MFEDRLKHCAPRVLPRKTKIAQR